MSLDEEETGRPACQDKILHAPGQHSPLDMAQALLRTYEDWGLTCWLSETPLNCRDNFARPWAEAREVHPADRSRISSSPKADTRKETSSQPADSIRAGDSLPTDHAARTPMLNDSSLHPGLTALARTAMTPVAPIIVAQSRFLIIGDVPNADEDRSGLVFSGEAGLLLDRMLASIRLKRTHISLAPALPWRPPGGRKLNPAEIVACRGILEELISSVEHQPIVTMGAVPLKLLLGENAQISALRGKWRKATIGGAQWDVLPMRHPLQVLTGSRARQDFWNDFLTLVSRCPAR